MLVSDILIRNDKNLSVFCCIAFETTLAEGTRLEKRLFHATFGLVS
jgi:hypothetical protein